MNRSLEDNIKENNLMKQAIEIEKNQKNMIYTKNSLTKKFFFSIFNILIKYYLSKKKENEITQKQNNLKK